MTDDEIMELDISTYSGKSYERYDDGKLVEAQDTRIIEYEKAKRIKEFEKIMYNEINSNTPIHSQMNALYKTINPSSKRMELKKAQQIHNYIDSQHEKYDIKKAEVLACKTSDQVASVSW